MAPYMVKMAMLAGSLAIMTGCEKGFKFPGMETQGPAEQDASATEDGAPQTTRMIERDVEAPDAFQVTEASLWDGRPSLGGVWVAHPDVKDPERVIIRNEVNQKFVIGALFRRERDNPGPKVQVSSDAAETLGMLAGQPVKLNITALRREEVAETPPATPAAAPIEAPEKIEALSLDSPIELSDNPDSAKAIGAAASAALDKPSETKPTRRTSDLKDPYIQIGIFSVEKNANNTATALRRAGMIPTVRTQSAKGKTFYRVIVGPALTNSERAALLRKVKEMGFNDAYFIAN